MKGTDIEFVGVLSVYDTYDILYIQQSKNPALIHTDTHTHAYTHTQFAFA